ncbi:MAG: hypothetical protein GXP27_05710 [Planctomycetes bacterium]|nr:hypothetical protein [Planctomycetota bacterium]
MCEIVPDESGSIRNDVFFVLRSWVDTDEQFANPDLKHNWLVSSLPNYPGWVEIVHEERKVVRKCHKCGVTLQRRLVSLECDLYHDLTYDSFVPVRPLPTTFLVVGRFARKLRKSGLRGFRLVRARIVTSSDGNAYRRRDIELYALDFLGKRKLRPWRFTPGVKNVCPFCGHGPLQCPECGCLSTPCRECGREATVGAQDHGGSGDRRLRVAPLPESGPILEGKDWDGSDFVYHSIITKRARDWLLSVHAAPIAIGPARVCIDGMSDEQLQWLEEAQKPLPSQAKPKK